jgi:hypothetical protein
MANQLDQDQLSQIVAAVLNVLKVQGAASKDAAPVAKAGNSLEQKDKALIAGFRRKGIPLDQIKLMDRGNPAAEYNIKPFRAWLELGWQVRRGERSVKGLFHQSQCDRITPKAQPKAKAKAKAKGKLAPATLPLV